MLPYFSIEKIFVFRTWGLFLALALLGPFLVILKKAAQAGIKKEVLWDFFFWIVVGSFLGMRLGYVLQFPSQYFLHPLEVIKLWDGGMTFYGGLVGGSLGAFLFKHHKKVAAKDFWLIADLVGFYFPVGIVLGRIGCFLINDHQGAVTTWPWGIVWPDGTLRHPVALYLILNGLVLFFILRWAKKYLNQPGQIFWLFLVLYSLTRFVLDFSRAKATELSDPAFWGITFSQWLALFVAVIAGKVGLHYPKKTAAGDQHN